MSDPPRTLTRGVPTRLLSKETRGFFGCSPVATATLMSRSAARTPQRLRHFRGPKGRVSGPRALVTLRVVPSWLSLLRVFVRENVEAPPQQLLLRVGQLGCVERPRKARRVHVDGAVTAAREELGP